MRNHQSVIAAMPGHNRYFPLELIGFNERPRAAESDADIEVFQLPRAQRTKCERLMAMGFKVEQVLEKMRRYGFDEAQATAALIEGA
jgi:hypothetical protein